ncbi:hypothetical protein [Lelliottia amnigena]|uniref:hypothetical protein n=1 Tax=Lelliottia amnigena TaxID=61646 RepID=UPI00192B881C|nr:hypothetical protein [Lelliottia amnigena]MBL5931024.1 hypothetical protein [Lelliottia amnigena]QXZ17664.1 hypothetical protein I6L75_10925 [Lelliottia amnigena]
MAKDGKHIIHAGGVFPNPLLNREGGAAASTLPGTVGFFSATDKFTASVAGAEAAIKYVANKDYLRCLSVDDAIATNELVVGIHPLPGMFLNVRAAAGTYTKGQPVAVANGRVTAVVADAVVFAYVEEDKAVTAVAGDLIRVVFK